ncbi:hypothetical protein Acr_20g0008700 [Actinidia rufa]|uniref:Pectin lyase-like superfamily protein n=1 Tax=Actinidia rufa TaxID=165716 RepID=A0A7J0GEB1_9ERIC|nr:hypothetical protein Acr_20g0008700 [Actinidia rufa]
MSFSHCKDIVVNSVKITVPRNNPSTDNIHATSSTNISITSSTIGVGNDCVSIGPGTTKISVVNVTNLLTLAVSGALKERNVRGVTRKNCTINGTQKSGRVKTWLGSLPSMAVNMTFQCIVLITVSNPIAIDQEYCPNHTCLNYKPSRVKLRNIHFSNIKGIYRSKSAVPRVQFQSGL